ncbi:MAG TPA: dihydrofolate reductase family protein [Candidatus Kapabacteria bacterium]|jgi:dihydrofolate reductase|nr:dihydrofolate reductase family protein [Candidatus Kapabacteria bacterium]
MRNLIYSINISVDGCCDHTHFNPDEEMMDYFTHTMDDVDLLVYGRKTYELMVPYWPDVANAQSGTKAENEFAQRLTAIDKVVFSKTLDRVEGNTKIVREDPGAEILKLKEGAGKKIAIGGVSLPSQLMERGLIDEYYFVVYPVIVAEGRRLLEGASLPEKLNLKLVDTKIFQSGAIGLHYLKQ